MKSGSKPDACLIRGNPTVYLPVKRNTAAMRALDVMRNARAGSR